MSFIIRHTMCAFMPSVSTGDDAILGLEHADIQTFLPRLKQENGFLFYAGLWLLSLLFMLTPIFTISRPIPSFLLDTKAFNQHTERFEQRFRKYATIIRLTCALCWGSDPIIRQHLGLEPYEPDSNHYRGKT